MRDWLHQSHWVRDEQRIGEHWCNAMRATQYRFGWRYSVLANRPGCARDYTKAKHLQYLKTSKGGARPERAPLEPYHWPCALAVITKFASLHQIEPAANGGRIQLDSDRETVSGTVVGRNIGYFEKYSL